MNFSPKPTSIFRGYNWLFLYICGSQIILRCKQRCAAVSQWGNRNNFRHWSDFVNFDHPFCSDILAPNSLCQVSYLIPPRWFDLLRLANHFNYTPQREKLTSMAKALCHHRHCRWRSFHKQKEPCLHKVRNNVCLCIGEIFYTLCTGAFYLDFSESTYIAAANPATAPSPTAVAH